MSNESDAQHAHFVQLVDDLTQQWQVLAAEASQAGGDTDVQAYLVLNRWADNPLAEAIEGAFPALAQERCAVPDEIFKDRLDRAPCLLPLPRELAPHAQSAVTNAELARDTLARWLAFTWTQVSGRLSRQDLCAVVFSTEKARPIAQHWVELGTQYPPEGGAARLFRYHDPRVMQRVWPLLTAAQKLAWLGPVAQWWSLEQSWGPFNADEHAQWFQGQLPTDPGAARVDLHRLLDARQWHAAHVSPSANRIWLDYAEHGIATVDQPPGDVVIRLLADAQRLRLNNLNAEDYVQCTWLHQTPDPQRREHPWHEPPHAAALQRILQKLREQPDARFATLLPSAYRA